MDHHDKRHADGGGSLGEQFARLFPSTSASATGGLGGSAMLPQHCVDPGTATTTTTTTVSAATTTALAEGLAIATSTALGGAGVVVGGGVGGVGTAAANGGMAGLTVCGGGTTTSAATAISSARLAQELEDFVERGLQGALAAERGDKDAPSEEAIAEMQLQTARKLRQLLPTSSQKDHLLPMVQETQNWISLLLGWLSNSYDRPAVQIEALLALTNIAGLSPHNPPAPTTAASLHPPSVAAAAGGPSATARAWGVAGDPSSSFSPPLAPYAAGTTSTTSSSAASVVVGPTTHPVPVPQAPPPAVGGGGGGGQQQQALLANLQSAVSITAPSSGAATSSTTATTADVTGTYNILLHHPSAIPTLISLLRSPHAEVHEQACWILGSIVVASGHGAGTTAGGLGGALGGGASAVAATTTATDGTSSSSLLSSSTTPSSSSGGIGSHEYGGTGPPTTTAASSSSSAGGGGAAAGAAASAARELVLAAGIVGPLCACLNGNAWNLSLQRIGSWLLSNLVLPSAADKAGGGGQSSSASGGGKLSTLGGGGGGSSSYHTCGDSSCTDAACAAVKGSKGGGTGSDRDGGGGGTSSSSGGMMSSWGQMKNDGLDMDKMLPTLRRLLNMADADVLSHTCWALSHLCDGPSSHIAAVVGAGTDGAGGNNSIPSRLVDLLLHPSWRVTKPALRTIGNVVCAECTDDSCGAGGGGGSGGISQPPPDYTEIVLQCGAVPHLKQLISHGNREIQKEACWTLSNIAAGTVDQIQAVIDSGAIPPLVRLASDANTDHEVRSEACWVVLNATSCGSDAQVEVLIADGCVSVLRVLLGEASMVMMALEGLERVLQVEESREKARQNNSTVDVGRGKDPKSGSKGQLDPVPVVSTSFVSASLMETLEQHKNTAIAKRASRIWKQHFVSCALCRKYFSKHRPSEAHFCNECKCHVCSSCDCQVYHLSYQEELWAASEEKTQANRKAKKSKKQKKKEKRKQAKKSTNASTQETEDNADVDNIVESNVNSAANASNRGGDGSLIVTKPEEESAEKSSSSSESVSVGPSGGLGNEAGLFGSEHSQPKSGFAKAGRKKNAPDNTQSQSHASKVSPGKSDQKLLGADATGRSPTCFDDVEKEGGGGSPVDLVLYLQQTGSIIALAKLMDALDYDKGEDECEPMLTNKEGITM